MNEQINKVTTANNIPFIQKVVFFLTGLSCTFIALTFWFLFKDNHKYYEQLRIIKNGAVFGLIVPLIAFVFGFLVGFLGYFVAA